MKMASTYNPYSDIQKVFNAKVGWNNATTDEERKRQNEIANAARKNLEAYGYGDVATKISASGADATAARKIMEQYAPQTSVNDTDSQLITKHNNEIRNKTNELWGIQKTDRETMANKYNKLEETAYSNPFTTDEAQAILGKYSLAGLNARDNAVASGGGSNGGNIDSYSAANAMRQQASLISQGHTAVLDAHNNRINNVKGILSDLGIYQQNQDKGMQNTIGLQQNESQRLFENGETAKNNDVARKSEIASVTGYAPDEWVVSNNPYMNDDGTIKDQYKNVDFSAVMANAKKTGNEKAYNAAAVARYYKIMGDYGTYGQYDDGNYAIPGQQETEARRQFDEQTKATLASLGAETDLAKYEIDTKKTMADNENATNLSIAQVKANPTSSLTYNDIVKQLKNTKTPSQELIDAYNAVSNDSTTYTVNNPPSFTGSNVKNGTVEFLDDESDTGDSNGSKAETTETKNGVAEHLIQVGAYNEKTASSVELGEKGKKVVKKVISMIANGELGVDGYISNFELTQWLINNSDANDTNKNQLKKVFAYFGIDTALLDNTKDSGFWFWDWDKGVKTTTK